MTRSCSYILLALAAVGCAPKAPTTTASPVGAPAAQEIAAPSRPLHEDVNEAVELLSGQPTPSEVQRAIDTLESLASQDPQDPLVRFNLGVGYQLVGDGTKATRAYQAVVGIDPSFGHAWLYLGKLQEENGRLDGAIASYRSGVRSDPENMDLRVALVEALRESGDLDGALEEARRALGVNARSLGIYNNMGLAYIEKGDLLLARFVFQKAKSGVEGADRNAYLNANLGRAYFLEGDKILAKSHLEKAVELDDRLVPALVYLSEIYMADRNYADTVGLLERASEEAPDNHGVLMNLGIAYRGVGRYDEARSVYDRALRLAPDNPAPYFNLGILLGDYVKDYDGAVEAFEQYKRRGGTETALVDEYIDSVKKEQRRAERRRKAEDERQRREAERAERQRLLEEAEKKAAQDAGQPPEEGTTPDPDPAPEADEVGATSPSPAPPEEPAAPLEEPAAPPSEAPTGDGNSGGETANDVPWETAPDGGNEEAP